MNSRESLRRDLARFGLFLFGAVASYLVTLGLPILVGRTEATLAVAIFTLVTLAVIYLLLNNRHTRALALRTDMVVPSYEEEWYRTHAKYQGKVYAQIEGLVRQAEKEILVLTDPSTETPIADHDSRERLLDAYIQSIQDHKANFTYTRVIQIPLDHADWSTADIVRHDLGRLTRAHCCKLLQLDEHMATEPVPANVKISILVIPVERYTTVVVIDRRSIVVNVEALAHQSDSERPYLETAIVVDDRAGAFGEAYHRYFMALRARSRALKREDFLVEDCNLHT